MNIGNLFYILIFTTSSRKTDYGTLKHKQKENEEETKEEGSIVSVPERIGRRYGH